MRTYRSRFVALAACVLVVAGSACFAFRPSMGGGELRVPGAGEDARAVDANDVKVPDGYRIEALASGLTFPTGVAFDDDGTAWVVESGYSYGEVFAPARLLR